METKEQLAENYCNKIYVEAVKEEMYAPDVYQSKKDFLVGISAKEKQIKDKINQLRADLSDVLRPKLNKVVNEEKVLKLKSQIEILEDML